MAKSASLMQIGAYMGRLLEHRRRPDLGNLASVPRKRRAEALVAACGLRVVEHGGGPAYDYDADLILMPTRARYWLRRIIRLQASYPLELLHEAAHATGHRTRLSRPLFIERFDTIYNREECVAEMASVMLMHDLDISRRPTLPHAKYLNTYLATLPNAEVELDVAAAKANQITAYLLALSRSGRASA